MNYLALKYVETDQRLLNLLPAEVAIRCHAIPVAWDGSRVTIAMAHPEDDQARKTVIAALGSAPCIVQADPQMLERLLKQIQVETRANPMMQILFWAPATAETQTELAYARDFCKIIKADARCLETSNTQTAALTIVYQEVTRHKSDLLAYSGRVALHSSEELIQRMPTNLLLIRDAHLPVQRILLILQQSTLDFAVLEWGLLLAQATGASLNLLPILPPVPGMLRPALQHSLPELLASNCPLGAQLRAFSRRLVQAGVNGSIHLRQEYPEQQIQQELSTAEHDLVLLALGGGRRAISANVHSALLAACQPLLLVRRAPSTS